MSEGIPHLADRLNTLIESVPREKGTLQRHTNESIVEALAELGIKVTPAHIANLRTGRRDNPSALLLRGIATVFDVPTDYFFSQEIADSIQEGLATLTAIQDKGLETVMLRAQGVSSGSLSAVLAMLEQMRRIEGLNAEPQEPQEEHPDA